MYHKINMENQTNTKRKKKKYILKQPNKREIINIEDTLNIEPEKATTKIIVKYCFFQCL